MALSLILGESGFMPDYVDATAHVTVEPHDRGFKITRSHIVCEARVPGIDQATFAEHAQAAKAGCPVSQLWLALRSPSRPGSSQIDS